MDERTDLYRLLDDLAYHGRSLTRLVTEIRMTLIGMSLPEGSPRTPCPVCGLPMAGERTLAFHLQNVHDGPPVPLDKWESEDEAASIPPTG